MVLYSIDISCTIYRVLQMLETGTWETMRCPLGWQPCLFEPGSVSGTGNPWGLSAASCSCRPFQHLFQPFPSKWHVWTIVDIYRSDDLRRYRFAISGLAKSETLFIKDGARQPNSSKTQARSMTFMWHWNIPWWNWLQMNPASLQSPALVSFSSSNRARFNHTIGPCSILNICSRS